MTFQRYDIIAIGAGLVKGQLTLPAGTMEEEPIEE